MNGIKAIIILIELIILAIGVTMIFDARKITEKWFGFAKKNESAKMIKIAGFTLSIISAILIMIN